MEITAPYHAQKLRKFQKFPELFHSVSNIPKAFKTPNMSRRGPSLPQASRPNRVRKNRPPVRASSTSFSKSAPRLKSLQVFVRMALWALVSTKGSMTTAPP